jgi:putative DNA primase/helicase
MELSEAGKSTREIGKELSTSKSRVDRLLKKAKRMKKAKLTEPKQ